MKVLLVEDEEFIRDLFKRQLDLSGFTTDAFGTGQDGLNAISKNGYDLVLLDIMLPDINGLQILQNIRQNEATKSVAVILLTNLGQDAVIKQGFELGADGYLVKAAYTPDQIVQEVKNIMAKKQTQNNIAAAQPGVTEPQTQTAAPASTATPAPANPIATNPMPSPIAPDPAQTAAPAPGQYTTNMPAREIHPPTSAVDINARAVSNDTVISSDS